MKLKNNNLVFEVVNCWHCQGKGTFEYGTFCPNYNKKMYGKVCKYCGSKSQHGHKVTGKEIKECDICKGTGKVQETESDFLPKEIWQNLTFKVTREQRNLTLGESLLALNLVYSCTDYGRAWKETDENLIDSVKNDQGSHQVNKIYKDGNLCNYINIILTQNGYTVVAVFDGGNKDVKI